MARDDRPRRSAKRAALACGAGYVAAFAVAMAAWTVFETERAAKAMARAGQTAAEDMAFLAAAPLARDDRIRLSLLAERLVEHAGVRSVAVYRAGGAVAPFVVVGSSAPPDAPTFKAPIARENQTLGEARVTMRADAFRATPQEMLARAWPFWLAGLALTMGLGAVASALGNRGGPAAQGRGGERFVGATEAALDAQTGEPLPPPQGAAQAPGGEATYLLAASLFGRAGMAARDREHALRQGMVTAEGVAAEHGAVCAALPGAGVLLALGPSAEEDGAFHAARAALALCATLAETFDPTDDDASPMRFRYCLDAIATPLGDAPQDHPRVRALAQLAPLAPDGAVLVCAEAFARLVAPERLRLAAFDNPAAAALATEAAPHCLALGLADG